MQISLRIPAIPPPPGAGRPAVPWPPGPGLLAAAAPAGPMPPDNTSHSFDFLEDSGAADMLIFDEDVEYLQELDPDSRGRPHPLPRCLGIVTYITADGSTHFILNRELEVNIWDPNKQDFVFADWESIPVAIIVGDATNANRLNGPWLRTRLYCATVPDQSNRLWMFDYNPGIPGRRPTLPSASRIAKTAPYLRPRPKDIPFGYPIDLSKAAGV
jgi:hypothetical protein